MSNQDQKIHFSLKNKFIILLFTLSIFFSHTNFLLIEFRFLYLISFVFIILELFFSKKIPYSIFFISFVLSLLIFVHSFIIYFYFLNDSQFFLLIKDIETKKFILKIFFQSTVIFLSILIIFYYKDLLVNNIGSLIDNFVYIFIPLLFYFNFKYSGIVTQNLFNCDLGFFYNTKFIFKENSHFSLIALPVLMYFIYNIKTLIKKKIKLTFYLLFFIFTLGNISLTLSLSIISSIIIILIICKKLSNVSVILFILFASFTTIFMLFDKSIYSLMPNNTDICKSKAVEMNKKYDLGHKNLHKGKILTMQDKITSPFLKNDFHNLSVGIYIYSLFVSKQSITEFPLGVGINNYINFRNQFDKNLINWFGETNGIIEDDYQCKYGCLNNEI